MMPTKKKFAGKPLDEVAIRKRLIDSIGSVKQIVEPVQFAGGKRIAGPTARKIRSILKTVEDLVSDMDDDWEKERFGDEERAFLEQKTHEQIAYRGLRIMMQAAADLVQCKQQLHHAEGERRKKEQVLVALEALPRPPPSTRPTVLRASHRTRAFLKDSQVDPQVSQNQGLQDASRDEGLFASPDEKEIKLEPLDDTEKEIKTEPLDEFAPNESTTFGGIPELPQVPKLEEPDDVAVGVASSSSCSYPLPSDAGAPKQRMQPKGKVCHFCKSYTEDFWMIPTEPEERKEFLVSHLICANQDERNAREVLLFSSRVVYFCDDHVTERYARLHGHVAMEQVGQLGMSPVLFDPTSSMMTTASADSAPPAKRRLLSTEMSSKNCKNGKKCLVHN